MFRHPKYYKELRKRNKALRSCDAYSKENSNYTERQQSDQVISGKNSTECKTRAPGPGLKLQALKLQATSIKPFAASVKLQAASDKLSNLQALIKFQATSIRGLNADETILRMTYMEGNLVWLKPNRITFGYFKLYCKKCIVFIVCQYIWSA